MSSPKSESQEEWKDAQQFEEGGKYEFYQKKWWEKWIFENRKLHYFLAIIGFFVLIFLVGYYSGLWFHVGSLFIIAMVLTMVEILRIRRHMYYVVETRLAGDIITHPEGKKFVVNETITSLVEIPDFAYRDFKHVGTNGAPLPVQNSRVLFADYVDLENRIIYHSPDLEFANVVLSAGANTDMIAARTSELREFPAEKIELAIQALKKLESGIKIRMERNPESTSLWRPLLRLLHGRIAEIEELKKIAELDDSVLLSKEFEHTFRITPSVKRNLFLHYKNTIPDLRSALFLLQNNLREFADAVATAKLYSSVGKTMPLDVRRRIAEVFEKLGYGDIFSIEKKEEVKEHVVKE